MSNEGSCAEGRCGGGVVLSFPPSLPPLRNPNLGPGQSAAWVPVGAPHTAHWPSPQCHILAVIFWLVGFSDKKAWNLGLSNAKLSYYDGMIQLNYKDGSPYNNEKHTPRMTLITFLCDRDAGVGVPEYQVGTGLCEQACAPRADEAEGRGGRPSQKGRRARGFSGATRGSSNG